MAQWDKTEFEAAAAKLASAYRAGMGQNGSDINALAAKVARDNNLNEEQIRRLVRATNVAIFDQEFGSLKKAGAPDRIVEFDPGDGEAVIRELYKQAAPPTMKVATAAKYPLLPNELSAARGRPVLPAEKCASVEDHLAAIENALGKEPPLDRQIMRLQKVADELSVQIKAANLAWNASMQELDHTQRQIYFNRDAFEKNAIALHGGEVLPEINVLRAGRKLSTLRISAEKLASLDDRLLGEPTPEAKLLKYAATARKNYVRFTLARKNVGEKLSALRARLLHG